MDGSFGMVLEPGEYTILFSLQHFQSIEYEFLRIVAGRITMLDAAMSEGLTQEIVVSTSSPEASFTSCASSVALESLTTSNPGDEPTRRQRRPAMSTSRLRTGFPETLLWVPELVTGADGQAEVALRLDLPPAALTGSAPLELLRRDGTSPVAAELQLRYHLPWQDRPTTAADSGNLAIEVVCDRHQALTGTPITCTLHAERVAFRGHGMLLAELGLPPGAEVDRLALEHDMSRKGGFEIQADRVILYLRAEAGGTDVDVVFRPRLAGRMRSTPSRLYDYYNPEARLVLAPQDFAFEEGSAAAPRQ